MEQELTMNASLKTPTVKRVKKVVKRVKPKQTAEPVIENTESVIPDTSSLQSIAPPKTKKLVKKVVKKVVKKTNTSQQPSAQMTSDSQMQTQVTQPEEKQEAEPQDTKCKQFRLLDFNAYDGSGDSGSSKGSDEDETQKETTFIVQYFGIDENGDDVCACLTGFKPFFYVKIPHHWSVGDKDRIREFFHNKSPMFQRDLISIQIIKRKKLYGFDAGKQYKFAMLKFNNTIAFNRAKALWYKEEPTRGGGNQRKQRKLLPGGLLISGEKLILYEAHVPPLLRQFHIQEISPSGWVSIDKTKAIEQFESDKISTCKYEYEVDYRYVTSVKDKETAVPYKIMSFDIEASSSHGDFPLPIKDYRKLAENIMDYVDSKEELVVREEIKELIMGAFGYGSYVGTGIVDKVFTKTKISRTKVESLIALFLEKDVSSIANKGKCDKDNTDDIASFFTRSIDIDADIEVDDMSNGMITAGANKKKAKATITCKKGEGSDVLHIVDILNDCDIHRLQKVQILIRLFGPVNNSGIGFPQLQGDKVTFIGSTFRCVGQEKAYLNHCIVLNTCDIPDDVDNAIIESYNTEAEVLLAWKELVRRENPDIIIGYNIFGFDYEFMFRRACECDVAQEFLELSKIRGEVCGEYRDGILDIERNAVQIASGQHEFKFIKMHGRVQIDMLNYMRRDYNLTSYKLDSVANEFIGDNVKSIEYDSKNNKTRFQSKNLIGLEKGNYVSFEEIGHSSDQYKDGAKFMVIEMNEKEGWFCVNGNEQPDMTKKVRWGLAKDDVTPQDIFHLANGSSSDRAIIAKYCIQDCNLVQHLVKKIDVITGFIEMANISSVPISFLVFRGQGIKLTSYLAKKCREMGFLIPTIDKGDETDAYEGAIVLDPKVGLYNDNPVACLDYASLYPSEMIADNISHDSKVWVKSYDLEGNFLGETGEKDKDGNFIYDNLPGYEYVDITYDHYKMLRVPGKKNPKKTLVGKKTCRFAQFPEGCGVLPAILKDLLAKRKATRKQGAAIAATDPFLANVLDKRQLSYKVTANSIYGQCGAKTSTFYELDVAASTTAGGQMMLMYAKHMLERSYINRVFHVDGYGDVKTNAEYVYGDTDSVFFTFNLSETDGTPIRGQRALELTIKLAQEAGELASAFLKRPHDLEYEKTFLPFCLLSKKRYVGMLYETDPTKCYRKSMGIVLKRRDNADIVKDSYGGVIDILMKGRSIEEAADFTKSIMNKLLTKQVPMSKLVITKSLRSGYANPQQIAHKVLADRIALRDPGNKPSAGSRIAYAYIVNPEAKKQGERIETPEFINANKCMIDYSHYITNQIMKPLSQVFGLCVENMKAFHRNRERFLDRIESLKTSYAGIEPGKYREKEQKIRDAEVKKLIFDEFINKAEKMRTGQRDIRDMFRI